MRKKKTIIALILVIVFCAALFSGCGTPQYKVTFDLNGGELVSGDLEQTVEEGSAAVAPQAENGRMALSWDTDFSAVKGDLTVTAQWSKVAMSPPDLAEYVQDRTVTVNVEDILGGGGSGTGFFIDSDGTLVTNYHVIDMASKITVQALNGATYDVEKIVDFSNLYDLAVLKIDLDDTPYLEFAEEALRTGEQVYAVGSALGTLTGSFTSGTVSSTKRTLGLIECAQMDAAISHGNSGGPLVNVYGEVVGINSYSYSEGENLNLAIKPSMLDKLSMDKNYSVKDFTEWYNTESARSWSPSDYEGGYYYSLVNTYQTVTGEKCLYSYCYTDEESEPEYYEGYLDMCDYYVYDYNLAAYDTYVDYLKSVGFVYDGNEQFDGGTSYYYYNELDYTMVDLFITYDNEELWIFVTLE